MPYCGHCYGQMHGIGIIGVDLSHYPKVTGGDDCNSYLRDEWGIQVWFPDFD